MCQNAGVLYILTYKYALRHSSVPFFEIGISKIAPEPRCFVHFGLQSSGVPFFMSLLNSYLRTRRFKAYFLKNLCMPIQIGPSLEGPRGTPRLFRFVQVFLDEMYLEGRFVWIVLGFFRWNRLGTGGAFLVFF